MLLCTHIGSSKRFTHLSSGISHCFLYFKKNRTNSPVGNDCCWIQEGRGKPLCCLFATSWKPASMEQPFASEATIFTPCGSSWLPSQAMLSSSVWTAVFCGPFPLPVSCTPHSSSGFAVLFSAASCTKLCCDCAVGLDLAKNTAKPLLFLPNDSVELSAPCTLFTFCI